MLCFLWLAFQNFPGLLLVKTVCTGKVAQAMFTALDIHVVNYLLCTCHVALDGT
jgi:hypothetical protein